MGDSESTPLGSRTRLRNGEASAVQLSSSCQVVTATPWAESLEIADSPNRLAHRQLAPPSWLFDGGAEGDLVEVDIRRGHAPTGFHDLDVVACVRRLDGLWSASGFVGWNCGAPRVTKDQPPSGVRTRHRRRQSAGAVRLFSRGPRSDTDRRPTVDRRAGRAAGVRLGARWLSPRPTPVGRATVSLGSQVVRGSGWVSGWWVVGCTASRRGWSRWWRRRVAGGG